jgi:hypothetical protein
MMMVATKSTWFEYQIYALSGIISFHKHIYIFVIFLKREKTSDFYLYLFPFTDSVYDPFDEDKRKGQSTKKKKSIIMIIII